ncbi:3-deoxy-D-manno-octulosonic acid transferase [Caulobacter segnis]
MLIASTHPGEDEIVLDAIAALPDRPPIVLAPRHVERGPAIADLAHARLSASPRSRSREAADILVADTLGEMGLWFRLAGTSVIAGSLVPDIGGHNPLEAARLNCPRSAARSSTIGPRPSRGWKPPQGVVMTSPDGLRDALAADLADPAAAKAAPPAPAPSST